MTVHFIFLSHFFKQGKNYSSVVVSKLLTMPVIRSDASPVKYYSSKSKSKKHHNERHDSDSDSDSDSDNEGKRKVKVIFQISI